MKREYFGEDIAADLIAELNQGEKLPLKLNEMLSRIHGERDRDVRLQAINKMNWFLAGYPFTPAVTTAEEFTWVPGYISRADGTVIDGNRSPYLVNLWLKAQSLGVLSKIKQCEVCSKWFFAKFSHANYDTVECRDIARDKDPERKKDRKRYQREYYQRRLKQARKSWRAK